MRTRGRRWGERGSSWVCDAGGARESITRRIRGGGYRAGGRPCPSGEGQRRSRVPECAVVVQVWHPMLHARLCTLRRSRRPPTTSPPCSLHSISAARLHARSSPQLWKTKPRFLRRPTVAVSEEIREVQGGEGFPSHVIHTHRELLKVSDPSCITRLCARSRPPHLAAAFVLPIAPRCSPPTRHGLFCATPRSSRP